MSPRPGGEAAKFGDRFEGRWTVTWMLEVLRGRADAIIVETNEPLQDTVEFEVRTGRRVEGHQVKRQLEQTANWTPKRLEDHGILDAAEKNVSVGREFCFVSTIPALQLEQLTDLARRSDDAQAFAAMLRPVAQTVRALRDRLAELWAKSPQEVFEVLRLISVEKPSEEQLERSNTALAEVLVTGPGAATAATLAETADDNLGLTLTADVIWAQLKKRGLGPVPLQDLNTAAVRAAEATERWRTSVTREQLRPAIVRAETAALVETLRGSDRIVLLSGGAGSGKSGVAEQAITELAASGWSVLGFRLDRLQMATTARQIGEQLDLPASPALTLAQIAQGRDALLVIDQLDAVSLASGRLADLYDVVEEIVEQAKQFPDLRVVLACRDFDLQTDQRLRQLAARDDVKRVEVRPLSDADVEDALAEMSIEPGRLSGEQLALLRSPLNLVLLRAVGDEHDGFTFTSTVDLLDAYWQRKRRDCLERRAGVRFGEIVSHLVGLMSAARRLDAPLAALDEHGLVADAEVLASEHVLVVDGNRVAFFHESFFDYAFARVWTAREQSLVEFLVEGEQELFRRAQVRQVLLYLRQVEPPRFVRELRGLLGDERIRFHIKHAVLAVLRALDDPIAQEWRVLEGILDQEPEWAGQVWLVLRTPAWFDVLDGEGLIERWLDDAARAPRAVELMVGAVRERPGRIAEILAARAEHPDFPAWFRWIARWAPFEDERSLFELLLHSVRAGIWDGPSHGLWIFGHGLAGERPEWAVELVHCWLAERPAAERIDSLGRLVDLQDSDQSLTAFITDAARGAPAAFCETLLPWMLRAMAMTARKDDEVPHSDNHFSHRMKGTHIHGLDDALLAGASQALEALGANTDDSLQGQLEPLAADEHDGAQYLLYKGLAAAGPEYAGWAGELLLEGEHRFRCGYSSDRYWIARELIEATAPGMSDERFAAVEEAILAFEPESERDVRVRQWRGQARLTLLDALPRERLSERGVRALGELQRKLGEQVPEPLGMLVGAFHSPIDINACRLMSDDQWIAAIERHDEDEGGERRLDFIGGAYQLSQHLAELTKEDPLRFARVGLRLTGDHNPNYLSAILRGVGQAEHVDEAEPAFELIRHARALGHPDHERWLTWPLHRLLVAAIPLDIVELLIERTQNAADPDHERNQRALTEERDLHMLGINSARGSIAGMLGDLVISDKGGERSELIAQATPSLVRDPSPGVRVCVAHILHAFLPTRSELVLDLLPTLLETDELILATRLVENLLAGLAINQLDHVRDVIERMLASEHAHLRQAGGRLKVWAALAASDDDLAAAACGHADEAVRKGAAEVLTAQIKGAANREAVIAALRNLLIDDSEGVREEAAGFVTRLRGENLGPWRELLEALIASGAFESALPQLVITLETARGGAGDLVLVVARRLVVLHGAVVGDIATRAAADAKQVGELVLRAERETTDPAQLAEVLDIVDVLLVHGAYGFAEAVVEAER